MTHLPLPRLGCSPSPVTLALPPRPMSPTLQLLTNKLNLKSQSNTTPFNVPTTNQVLFLSAQKQVIGPTCGGFFNACKTCIVLKSKIVILDEPVPSINLAEEGVSITELCKRQVAYSPGVESWKLDTRRGLPYLGRLFVLGRARSTRQTWRLPSVAALARQWVPSSAMRALIRPL